MQQESEQEFEKLKKVFFLLWTTVQESGFKSALWVSLTGAVSYPEHNPVQVVKLWRYMWR